MFRRRRYGGQRSGRSRRRQLQWARNELGIVSLAAGAGVVYTPLAAWETASGNSAAGCTIMRVLLKIAYAPHAATAGTSWASGLLVDDTAAPLSSIDPDLKPHLDWLWWTREVFPLTAGGVVTVASGNYPRWIELDLRGKRKIPEASDDLLMPVKAVAGANTDIDIVTSILLALP